MFLYMEKFRSLSYVCEIGKKLPTITEGLLFPDVSKTHSLHLFYFLAQLEKKISSRQEIRCQELGKRDTLTYYVYPS